MELKKLQSLRVEGMLLAGSALLAAVLMHHHPQWTDGAIMIRLLHGAFLALNLGQLAILALVTRALGWSLPTALGLTFIAMGTVFGVLAGTINGFVVPALWAYPEGEIGPGISQLAWEMNQQLARNGAVATGIGMAFLGAVLWQQEWRVTGILGVLAGAVPAVLLITGVADMKFEGAILTYVTQLIWMVALGTALFRAAGKVTLPSTP